MKRETGFEPANSADHSGDLPTDPLPPIRTKHKELLLEKAVAYRTTTSPVGRIASDPSSVRLANRTRLTPPHLAVATSLIQEDFLFSSTE